MKIHQDNAGHMTKMAAMLIYGKNTLKIFFPGTTGLTLYEAYFFSNYDPLLTLTYFMESSNFAIKTFIWEM